MAINAEVISETAPDTVVLSYRLGGRPEYATLPMALQPDGGWISTIPGDLIGLRGIEYYLEGRDQDRVAHLPAFDYAEHPLQQGVQVTDCDGGGALMAQAGTGRMISLPAVLSDGSVQAVLGDDLGEQGVSWQGGRWNAATQSYCEFGQAGAEAFAPGSAFWLLTEQTRRLDFTGATVFAAGPEGIAIELAPGWNQIGNPYAYEIALGDARVDDGAKSVTIAEAVGANLLEVRPLHAYDGEQYHADGALLSPWTGYFIANLGEKPLDLVLQPREAYAWGDPLDLAADDPPDWWLQMTAQLGEHPAGAVRLGAAGKAAEAWDARDRLVPPLGLGQSLSVRSLNKSMPDAVQSMQCDVRPVSDPGASWTVEIVAAEAGTIRLAWDLSETVPTGYGVRVIDLDRQIWVDGTPAGAYAVTIREPQTLLFTVAIGTTPWLDDEAEAANPAGEHFALSYVGPNPHRGQTQLRLVLQQPEQVSLQAYDVNGRLVRTLQDGTLATGVHLLAWDGRTQGGSPAPAGVYFLRLTGAGREIIKRDVMLR
ncbi:MAG: FlgD immunoglobulin-like domain containing protein [Candidatus Eisenbacteria bacterium]